jgi:tetratricopeptide (TPR) repeat protein
MGSSSGPADYVRRDRQETEIRRLVELVREDGRSRVVLLYGAGGVGKTRLVRALPEVCGSGRGRSETVWVKPIDVDDSVYWLLSNLEQAVAATLDPQRRYFDSYFQYLSRLPRYTQTSVGPETVVSHLGRIKGEFVSCYQSYVTQTGKTVAITLDTVEAVRSTYLQLSLIEWMNTLPRTLFILSGRPPAPGHTDPIQQQLADPHQVFDLTSIELAGFDHEESMRYLGGSALWSSLGTEEKGQLVELTAGQPLWLAIAVDYLEHANPPEEMSVHDPYRGNLRAAFRRRLVAPYQSTEFWSEAIRRLAVVRHSVNQQVWQKIMEDRPLPAGVESWDDAWRKLLVLPWVRPRANRRYVTLHDAFSEELTQRLIPLHDQDGSWRGGLWKNAAHIYRSITDEPDREIQAELSQLAEALQEPGHDEAQIVERIVQLDVYKRELDQLKTARLHYRLLDDFAAGCDDFIEHYEDAARRHDVLFQELICHEFERFLPHSQASPGASSDPLHEEVRRFGRWLTDQAPEQYLEVGLRIARFLTQNEQPASALALLRELPSQSAKLALGYQLSNEQGNACMRIPGQIQQAEAHFQRALVVTQIDNSPEWLRCRAQAYKELGFYYRNVGRWDSADDSYRQARDVISGNLGPGCSPKDREEMASIQTNWAYLKALKGNYEEARNLVESAISVRRLLDELPGVGVSLSVYGEVLRHDRQFVPAWRAYQEAEEVFEQLKSLPWLGQVYQEQAICLFQANQENIVLVDGDQAERSHQLIRRALDICRDYAVRAYPAALNRAGQICGADDLEIGLAYLEDAITEARKVADGRFTTASLIEFLDLSYQAWTDTGNPAYRQRLDAKTRDVEQVLSDYQFKDLQGRWELLQGHLAVHEAPSGEPTTNYSRAIAHYSAGFALLANQSIGSRGLATIAKEFRRFREIFATMPADVQGAWYLQLRSDWSRLKTESATALLARLEELY